MRAAMVTRFGEPGVFELVELPDLAPGPGEVVIGVEAADVLWLETMVRSGAGQDYWPMRPPYVPGNGVAGRVVRAGDGVDPDLLGTRVVAHTGSEGGYADQAVVGADALSVVPAQLGLTVAAALLHDAPTALALFDVTKVNPDDAVVVVGASGGLGIMLVQLGLAHAGRVVAIARGVKLDRVRALGPDTVIDSERADWLEAARTALPSAGADVVFDNVGGDLGEASFALTGDDGWFSAHGTPGGRFAKVDRAAAERRGITVTGIETVQMQASELKRYTDRALREAAAGTITPVIGQTFALEEAGSAHAAIEARTVFGKTLLTM